MRNKVKRTLSFLLTFVMLCSLLPAMALAKEPSERYEKLPDLDFDTLIDDATLEVFTTKDAGTIELTDTNLIENTFPQGSGFRQYKATAKEGWVFDTWAYEQWYEGKDLGNRTDFVGATRYSFSNEGDKLKKWRIPYTEGNDTISVNRLTTNGEVTRNSIDYKIYADFNPTITATAGTNGTISDAGNQVEVTYGDDQAFTITANDGYVIETITVDGQEVAEGKNEESYTYTFENVIEPHAIDVTFKVKPEPGKFTVTYEVEGDIPADYQAPEADIVNEGETYTVKSVPEPVVDYTFSGWYDENQNIVTKFKVTGDVTLTGVWTYTGEKDVWDTVYGSIRVYMDEGTEADFNNLPGLNIHKQVRIYSDKYPEPNYRLTVPVANYWGTTNIAEHVTARDISEIVLAKDKLVGSSEKINIPMTGNDDYQVTVSEGEDKFGLVPYTYLKIEITKKEPVEETVTLTYDANGGKGAPESVEVNKNTEYTLDSTTVPTHDAVQGLNVIFQGWSTDPEVMGRIYSSDQVPAVQSTVLVQDKDVTVYAVWAFDASQVPDVPVSGKTVEVTFTVNPEYGSFTEYGEGPVTFKNIDAESTQQFEVPKVTAKKGYKFVGWKGQGADVIEWGADASTFGVPGLCYFPEGSDVGYASIEAVFEEVPVSGKTVEVTFTVNPEYGSFTEYGKGPVTFKNIDAESTQQFEVPKVTAKKGYKFVGWKGQGADVIEWDANASTFGVPGLCYFAEGSNVGYASIAAVFEKEGGGHTNDYYVTVIVDGKGKVKAENYGTVGSNETEVIIIPDVENSVKFTMEPADSWKVDDVLVDGKSVGDVDSYVLKDDVMLEGPVLKVIFEKKSSGGGGGGSHDKDDDKDKTPAKTPDALNGEDHFDYIVGDADGRVHPERNITRAEVASIFFRLLKDDVRSKNLTDQNTFTDISADAWYNVAVSTMSDMDIVFGRTDYQFDPDAYITRAEFAAIAARFDSGSYSGDDLFTDIEGHWAADQINRTAEKGWITGYPDGTFCPNRYITRAEAVTMINRVLNRMPKDKDALHEDMKVFVDNADTNAWYYLAIQEATNSHEYKKDKDGVYETWTDVLPARDWAQYLKLN